MPAVIQSSVSSFDGPVVHTVDFKKMTESVLKAVKPKSEPDAGVVVVVGGGKSAQE